MMKLILEKIIVDSFKGQRHAEYAFNDICEVSGRNGSGKSSIYAAHLWLWTDRDAELTSNPEIHPTFMEESEPTVTEVLQIEDARFEVTKVQQDARTKKAREAGEPIKIKNSFLVNSVPMTQRDFVKTMETKGINMDDFLLLSVPEIFVGQKSNDCRKLLFQMSESKTDKEIADTMPECAELSKLLDNYTTEEVAAIYKRQKTQGKEELDSIPQKINGMELSKQEVDVAAVNASMKQLESSLKETQDAFEKIVIPDKATIEEQIRALQEDDKRKRKILIEDAEREFLAAKSKYGNVANEYESINRDYKHICAAISDSKEELNEKLARYEKLKAETFPEESTICPTCGRVLPKTKVDKIREKWQKEHDHAIAEMKEVGDNLAKSIKGLEADRDGDKAKLDKAESECVAAKNAMDDAEAKYDASRYQKPDTTNADKIAELQKQIDSINEISQSKHDKKAEIESIRSKIKECERELAKEAFNKNVDSKIEEMREKQKQVAQAVANAEKILYQLSILSTKKNELLEDSVNAHFPDFIRFKLFDYLKNGEVKDACIPMILDNGEWKNFNSAANNGLKVLAEIGILHGIQKFFKAHYPIFLDNAECLDSDSKQKVVESAETQIVFLTVNESPTLTISKM